LNNVLKKVISNKLMPGQFGHLVSDLNRLLVQKTQTGSHTGYRVHRKTYRFFGLKQGTALKM
jgi:hypothetical protein